MKVRIGLMSAWLLWLLPGFVGADAWVLNNDLSRVSFVTVKAGDIGEVHGFKRLSGAVSAAGEVAISIDLASVDTRIPIRDERMRELLFNVVSFPSVEVVAEVDMADFQRLPAGSAAVHQVNAEVRINGQVLAQPLDLLVSRLGNDRMLVATRAPAIVHAGSVGYVAGVEALREIAGLPSISKAAPVTFVLVFERQALPA